MTDVRQLGRLIECVHAPVYFAPESRRAYLELGLRGFWRGYFAGRAAALGTPDADEVTLLFGGFAPAMVARAVPEVWTIAAPQDVLAARQRAATTALTRLLPADVDVRRAAEALAAVAERADYRGCPLAAAHAALPRPDEPLPALWWAATALRELRGDVHLAVLAEYDLPWPMPHLLLDSLGRLDPQQREYRGFSEQEWEHARTELRARGLLGTAAAHELAEEIDARTDARTASRLGDVDDLVTLLTPIARGGAAELPFPNAIGLPQPFGD